MFEAAIIYRKMRGNSSGVARVGFIMFIGVVLSIAGSCLLVGLAQNKGANSPTARQTQVIVTITDTSGRYVGGLHKGQINLLDNDVRQDVLTIEESTFPVSIGLLFNVSRSRYDDLLALARKTILQFFEAPQKTNEYFIMGFDENSFLAADWTREPNELISGFDKLKGLKLSKKSVTTYEALDVGIKKMGQAKYFKRAIFMISDLNDPGSSSKRDQVLEMLKRSDILVYGIIVGTGLPRSVVFPALDRISSVSGGFAKDARNTEEVLDLMEIISLELRHQYLVSFIPTGAEGDWHSLRFEAKTLMLHPSSSKNIVKVPLFARGRQGYYPKK
jgi:VWFA-related protein